MSAKTELSVTLSPALYDHLLAESSRLGVELEWMVASLVVDTQETWAAGTETSDGRRAEPARRKRLAGDRLGRMLPWEAAVPTRGGATSYPDA